MMFFELISEKYQNLILTPRSFLLSAVMIVFLDPAF